MAVDMFIKIGDIKGEAHDSKHAEEIDVLSWSWGASNVGVSHMGGGGGSGKVNVMDLNFTKPIDKASPVLLLACCNGKHHGEATLIVRKAGEKPLEYMKVKMTDVLISSYNTGAHKSDTTQTEQIALNFAKVEVIYTPQDAKGAGSGEVKMGWDVKKNEKV